jgi:hypothetical protein
LLSGGLYPHIGQIGQLVAVSLSAQNRLDDGQTRYAADT